nr:hypothetical protein [Tanacetum cinerariifolium]
MDQNNNFYGFDQFQSLQYSSKEISNDELKIMMQSYFERMNQSREHEKLLAEQELRQQEQAAQKKEGPPQDSDIHQLITKECCTKNCREQKKNMEDTMIELIEVCRQKELYCMHDNEVKNVVEQPAERRTRILESLQNFRVIHKSSISLNNTSQISPVHAIAPIISAKEPEYSLSMGYEHLSTTPKTKLDEVTKTSAKNLVPIPSEYEVTSEDKSECDMPVKDESSPVFTTFSNPLFDDNDDFTSCDDESLPDEDVPTEEFKVYSNPFFDDGEINSDEIDPHCFNAESDLIESLLNRETLIDSSPKFDFLLKEFYGELAHINLILQEIKEADFELEEEIRFVENLLYDNSSPRLPKELNAEIADTIVEIESDDYDSEGDIHFLKELLIDDSIPFPNNELSNFDHQDDPSFPRLPQKPPDVEFFFDSKPDVIA